MYTPTFPHRQRALEQLRSNDPQVLHDDFLACDQFDVRGQVSSLALPTLIICGVADKMTPVKSSEALHQAIAGSLLEIVADAGHMVMIEQPALVTALVTNFVTGS
jgi:pimeloyl-ACP methyl ester carboxylesterase